MLQTLAFRLWCSLRYTECPVGFIHRPYAKDVAYGDKDKPKPSCKRLRKKTKCTKVPAPTPSFSECRKKPAKPKKSSECDCLKLDK